MRLSDIKRYINIAYENYNCNSTDMSSGLIQYKDTEGTKLAIKALDKAGIISIYEDPYSLFASTFSNFINVDPGKHPNIKFKMQALESTISILHKWINEYLPDDEDDTTINIKLPKLYQVNDLVKASGIINKALSQSVAESGGEVKIRHLDYGSSWLIISAGTALAAKLVMLLADAGFKIAQKYYGIKMMQQQYERFNMGTEMLKTIKEANEKIIATDARVLAEHIEKDIYKDTDTDNERIERLRVSITEMSKLIELGGEVHPALICASDNNISTPDYKSLLNVIKNAGELPRNENIKSEGEQNIPNDNQ